MDHHISNICPNSGESFQETHLEDGEDVIISWLHPSNQMEFCQMTPMPKNLWHIGEGVDGSCYDQAFVSKMEQLGYKHMYVTAKQLSQIDYFKGDHIRTENSSRTTITWFTTGQFPTDLEEICGKDNLGHFETVSDRYCAQDLLHELCGDPWDPYGILSDPEEPSRIQKDKTNPKYPKDLYGDLFIEYTLGHAKSIF